MLDAQQPVAADPHAGERLVSQVLAGGDRLLLEVQMHEKIGRHRGWREHDRYRNDRPQPHRNPFHKPSARRRHC